MGGLNRRKFLQFLGLTAVTPAVLADPVDEPLPEPKQDCPCKPDTDKGVEITREALRVLHKYLNCE